MDKVYDMIVVGGGPGGYSAALYAARAGLETVVIEKLCAGGQMALTQQIDNYPGFPQGVDGFQLGENMRQGALRFGAETVYAEVTQLQLRDKIKQVHTDSGVFRGKTVVLAMGADHRSLGLAGEAELVGRGVNYCAACDGMFYRGKTVAVVGGGNTAVQDALLLSRVAEKVILIHRRDTLRASRVLHDALQAAKNVEILWNTKVVEFVHDDLLTGLQLENVNTHRMQTVSADGVFISVGRNPNTQLVSGTLNLDASGYILADETTCTNIPGVFAVGDIRSKAVRQIVTAVSDGAVACHFAETYLAE